MATSNTQLLRNLGADEFVAKIDHYGGPYVTIRVEDKIFKLPKKLLCYHSRFFNAAFNGEFKEGVEQKMDLEECRVDIFNLIVQWLYVGDVLLPLSLVNKEAESLDLLIDFLLVADRIELLGPFDTVILVIKELLAKDFTILDDKHIRSAVLLPRANPLHTLLANACVRPYLYHIQPANVKKDVKDPRCVFKFQKELDDLEGFASDLLKAHREFVTAITRAPPLSHWLPTTTLLT